VNALLADANTTIIGAGLTVGTITYTCSDTIAAGRVISSTPTSGTSYCGAVAMVVSTGTCCVTPPVPGSITVPATSANGAYNITWTASTGATSYQLESSAPASGTTVFPTWVQIYSGTALTFAERVGGGTWSYRVKATACGSSAYRTGSNNCVVTNSLVGGNAGASENSDWVKWRYPACWSYSRQCRGDMNGKKTVTYVAANDFTAFTAAFGKTNAQLALIPNGICGDLNHKNTVTRVAANDFTIFTTYFGKVDASVPLCSAAPVITGPYNYWTVP
jgi:hypothetical protein